VETNLQRKLHIMPVIPEIREQVARRSADVDELFF